MKYNRLTAAVAIAAAALPLSAHATNGMNMEGYGPIATGMGGASMAYDNGSAAMANNPATLGLMREGESRLDLAVGGLGPDVDATWGPMTAGSDGDAYYMPAGGWVTRQGNLSYGVGVFAQGGMGTEYAANTFLGAMTGQDARSELGVGRLIAPLAFNVNDRLTIGGSLDLVWGGLDLKMPMPVLDQGGNPSAGTFADFMAGFGGQQVLGRATVTPGLGAQLQGAVGAGYDTVAINFSGGGDFQQATKGYGWGGKLGFTYRVNPQVTVGGTYHLKTSMEDWTGNGVMVLYDVDGPNPTQTVPGQITIRDFQWPATIAAGIAVTPNDRLLLAADVKVLQWSDVMDNFNLTFTTNGEAADITMFQNWDDQTVLSLGGAYRVTDAFTVRAGVNIADNPIPDQFVNPLFPAIIEEHYTLGFGYAFSDASEVNFSLTHAPEVAVTNTNTGIRITHSQTNWQFMYSYRF